MSIMLIPQHFHDFKIASYEKIQYLDFRIHLTPHWSISRHDQFGYK